MTTTKTKLLVTLPPSLQDSIKAYLNIELDEGEDINEVTALKRYSVLHRVGTLYPVALLHGEDIPIFLEIARILSVRNIWMLCGRLLRPTRFLEHEHAYVVEDTNGWHTCQPGSETDHTPLNKYTNSKGDITVFLKYRICANRC